jgi:hypothetical protein
VEGAGKLDSHSKSAYWLGVDPKSKGHCVYWPERHKISTERNIQFIESSMTTTVEGEHAIVTGGSCTKPESEKEPEPAHQPLKEPTPSQPTTNATNDEDLSLALDELVVKEHQVEVEGELVRQSPRIKTPLAKVQAILNSKGTAEGQIPQSKSVKHETAKLALVETNADWGEDIEDKTKTAKEYALAAMAGDEPTY